MSGPLFQHRHYVKIASIIAELSDDQVRRAVASHFAAELRYTNAQFCSYRFERAALGQPVNGKDRPR
jgi:hypothetical protein